MSFQRIEQNMNNVMPQFQNGRVINLTENPTPWFQLTTDNQPNKDFTQQALYGIQTSSKLSRVFFSEENVKLLQDMLRYQVYLKTDKKYIVGEQSPIELEIVMRSIYLQFSRNLQYDITKQVKELNNICLQQMVPQIISGIEQYVGYMWQVEHQPVPIEHPKNMSSQGTKLLRSVTSIF